MHLISYNNALMFICFEYGGCPVYSTNLQYVRKIEVKAIHFSNTYSLDSGAGCHQVPVPESSPHAASCRTAPVGAGL